ncbi:radical SAM protein [Marivita sp.]|uniref:radical SAM/SPASM domain-containing protein n=1 Tax=Marivita sp. TaxID=2003365 RepID=UPI0025C3D920|nr:radical SAM protein [Marivita sp.]
MSDARAAYTGNPEELQRWRAGSHAPPTVAVWEITLQCDLGCRHCGSRAGKARTDELSTAQAFDVIDQLADFGVREVTLIGGEAYLRPDWDRLASRIVQRGMACTMVTGGRAFTSERALAAAMAGISKIGVSLDGLAQTHDRQRGKPGSWESAVASIDAIRGAGIEVALNTQINRLTMPELPAVADFLIARGVKSWMVQLTVPMGRAADRPGLLLQPYELLQLFPLLAWIKTEKLTPNGIGFFPGNNVGYFGPYETTLRYGGEMGFVWAGCGAGRASIGIEADGKLKGCPSLPSAPYSGGNLKDRSLAEIFTTAPEITHIHERSRDDLWGFCKTCMHADRCKAGCTWTSHSLMGRPGNNPYCHHRADTLHQRGLRERVVSVRRAPGQPFDFGRFEIIEEDASLPLPEDTLGTADRTALARLFDLRSDAQSIWDEQELSQALKITTRHLEATASTEKGDKT